MQFYTSFIRIEYNADVDCKTITEVYYDKNGRK